MEYLYLIWYAIGLAVIAGILWHTLKQNGLFSKKEATEYENAMENSYGRKGYSAIKIVGGVLLILFWLYMLGKCSQEYLKI